MKLQIEQADFVTLLSRAQNIVEKRNAMPILINVLLDAEGDRLKIFATDLEVSLTDQVSAVVEQPGRVAVNAKSLFDILKELPEGPIEIEKRENNWLHIRQNQIESNIVGISPDEYPVFPSYSTESFVKIDSQVLSEMIEKTIYSVSNDETRYHLNGVYFHRFDEDGGKGFRMVATDGHRLSLIERSTGDEADKLSANGVIIPRKGLNEIRKLLDHVDEPIEMAIEGAQLVVRSGTTILMIRLIEGKYPNYQQLIPRDLNQRLSVKRDALLSSLKRVSLFSNQKSKGVTLNLTNGRMEISSNNPELGDARETIDVDYAGKDIRIGFNAKYILDVLSSMNDETVQIQLNDQLSPGLVRPKDDDSYTCVVMPMRI
ncbi:MAG: DNA polymerase III subunit beta [Bdellovibrionaceae bacterium]|nr:DNA polymerase III subunit beta [Bdellovibrionales bacterium]MCB9085453.1 DNA polymerase III subunit beta [Pseudobdellovibrionaceae bacterium]